jgi:hypothetical protein
VADVETHDALGVGIEPATAVQHLNGSTVTGAAACDDGGRAITEQSAGNHVGNRGVVSLDGQRAALDGDQRGYVVGAAQQIVVQASHAGRAGDTAQPHHGDPPHVGTQPDDGGDPGVQRWSRHPGDCGADDLVDVTGCEAGRLDRVLEGLSTELHGVLDEQVVGLTEVLQFAVGREGQHQAAVLDAGVGVQAAQRLLVEASAGDHVGERVGDLGLGVPVGRQRPSNRENLHVSSLSSASAGCGPRRWPASRRGEV